MAEAAHTPTGRKTVLATHAATEERAILRLNGIIEAHIADEAEGAGVKAGNIHVRIKPELHTRLANFIKKEGVKQNAFIEQLIEKAIPRARHRVAS